MFFCVPSDGCDVTVGSSKEKVDDGVGLDVDAAFAGVHLAVGVFEVVVVVEVELGNQFLKVNMR